MAVDRETLGQGIADKLTATGIQHEVRAFSLTEEDMWPEDGEDNDAHSAPGMCTGAVERTFMARRPASAFAGRRVPGTGARRRGFPKGPGMRPRNLTRIHMKKIFSAVGAAAMLLTGFAATPASADPYRDGYRHGGYHRYDRDGYRDRGWRDGRDRHHYRDSRRYRDGYRRHRDNDSALAAGAIGLGIGAIVGSALSNQSNGRIVNEGRVNRVYRTDSAHVRACAARYRSYDARTDTFRGFDGRTYRCNL